MQHSQGQADHLQVLGPGRCGDHAWLGAHVEDDALLQPGNEEVCALADDPFPHSRQSVEDDGARAASDIVYGLAGETDADGRRDG